MTSNLPTYEIRRGTRLAITLTDGTRLAGTATGKVVNPRGLTQELALRRLDGSYTGGIDLADIATITAL